MASMHLLALAAALTAVAPPAVGLGTIDRSITERPGPLLLVGGRHQDLPNDIRDAFFDLAGGAKAKIVVIPTAVAERELKMPEVYLKPPENLKPQSMQVLHTRDRTMADDPAFVKPLTEATAVFFTNGHLHRLTDVYPGTLVEKELKKLQARGGLIGGTGTGAAVLGDLVINRPHMERLSGAGLGLLPKFVILDDDTERGRPRLLEGLTTNPDHVGLTIDPGTAVVIRNKNLRVIGEGTVTVRLAKGAGKEAKIDTLKAGAQLDLIELRRDAASRAGKQPGDVSAAIVGTWETIDRHVAIGSLYQPVHGVRKREGVVQFQQTGDRLSGWAVHADHAAISYQERWKDGRTEFRKVSFTNDQLVFEFDIAEWRKGAGPLAVERGRLDNKGMIRVVAKLQGDRLAGRWQMYTADGAEVFRGEWEAVRAKKKDVQGEKP